MSSNLAYPLPLFVFYNVKNVLLEKFSEIVSRHTDVNIIVYLNGNADAVALSDAEAAGKHYIVLDTVRLERVLHELDDIHVGVTRENFREFFKTNILDVIENERN